MNTTGLEIGWKMAILRKKPENNLVCKICGESFARRGSRKLKAKNPSCCSIKCAAISKRKGTTGFYYAPRPKTGEIKACKTCGALFQRPPSHNPKYCSQKCRHLDKESFDFIRGERHYNWKGGKTPINQTERKSSVYAAWRMAVFFKDDYMCKACNYRGNKLQAHHMLAWSEYPELRFSILNGITLCKNCHDIHHGRTKQ